MTLDRLTQITESGIKTGITLQDINVIGVVTATSLSASNYGAVSANTLNVSGVSTFNANIFLGDGDAAYFGDSQDLLIFHNSTDSIIRDNGTGDLYIEGGNVIRMTNPNGIETYATFNQDAAVELYYDGTKKFETTSSGVSIGGSVFANNIGVNTNNTQTAEVYIVGSGKTEGLVISRRDASAFTPLIIENYAFGSGIGDTILNRAPIFKARRYFRPPFGNEYDGTSLQIDLGAGAGLCNIVAGSVLNAANTQYLYEGGRGSSRILLGDDKVQLLGASVSVGTTGAVVDFRRHYPPPVFRARQTTTQTLNNSVSTKITYTTEDFDTDGFYDPSTSRFQPNIPGCYQLTATISLAAPTNNHRLDMAFYIDGVENIALSINQQGSNNSGSSITALLYLNGSQFVEVYAHQNSGGNRSTTIPSLFGGTNTIMHFSGQLIHPG